MDASVRVGGSRAASILGVGFQTPFGVWAEMTGKVAHEDISDREHIEAGNFLEDAAARWFEHRTGLKVLDSPGLVVDQEYPWLSGTPDRAIILEDGTPGLLECKNTGSHARAHWSDDGKAPLGYQVQLQVYLRIVKYEVGYFAAIVAGQKILTPKMLRDDKFIGAMLPEIERFLVEHVQKDIPPPVDGHALGVLQRMFPKDFGRTIEFAADSAEDRALATLLNAKEQAKELEDSVADQRALLEAAMQNATVLVTPSGRITWKYQVSERQAQPAKIIMSRPFLPKRHSK